MLISILSPYHYAEATKWNQTNFFLQEELVICQIMHTIPVIDGKALACTCKKIYAIVILDRLEKYQTVENLILLERNFEVLREDSPLFDATLKREIKELSDKFDRYNKILQFLLQREFQIYKFDDFITNESGGTSIAILKSVDPLIRWVTVNDGRIVDKVFQFILDFGFPVKNLAESPNKNLGENELSEISLFEYLIQKPEKAIKLIEAGTRLEDCNKIIQKVKQSQTERERECPLFEQDIYYIHGLKIRGENITKVESYLEEFQKRGDRGSESKEDSSVG